MKSKHLFLRVKRDSLAFAAAILLFSSCVDGYKDDVRNVKKNYGTNIKYLKKVFQE